MKVVIFGAGSTGRGHLGAVLYEQYGVELVFVERDETIVSELKKNRGYSVLYVPQQRRLDITGVSAVAFSHTDEVLSHMLDADLILTAVIAENLPQVAQAVQSFVAEKHQSQNLRKVNIICCENLNHASSLLKKLTYDGLDDDLSRFCEEFVAFPDCMISRIVPLKKKGEPIIAEDYNEWVVDKSRMFPLPLEQCIYFSDNLSAFLEKKLWIHNGGHAAVGYGGFSRGHRYIHEALDDPYIVELASGVTDEAGRVIIHKYGFDKEDIDQYKTCLVERGRIKEMKDEILRVIRDPLRKLGLSDRLFGPAIYAFANGLPYEFLTRAIAKVLQYHHPDDAESLQMQSDIKRLGLEAYLLDTLGVNPSLATAIMKGMEF